MLRYITILSIILLPSCAEPEKEPTIIIAGDLLLDRGVRKQIERQGIDALFENVRTLFLEADAVIANLECPVTRQNAPVHKKYVFKGDPEWLPGLKRAGITHLVFSNNHTYDQGRPGLNDTWRNVHEAGIVPIGFGKDQKTACDPQIIRIGNASVAVFSSVTLTLEGWPYFEDSTGMCQASINDLCENIRFFKSSYPAQRVIVLLHWGFEHTTHPAPSQRMEARKLIDAGADVIIGHHPHVIQGMEIYKKKKIWYSIGNFVFDQQKQVNSDAWMIRVSFSEGEIRSDSIPIRISNCIPSVVE